MQSKSHIYDVWFANLLHICFLPFPKIERGGWYTESIVYKVPFYVRGRGWKTKTHVLSLIEKLNKMNNVNTMYMYSLNFMV